MKLVIDRSKWLRGEGANPSALLRSEDGKMCCLGFYGLACGAKPRDIRDVSAPADLAGRVFPGWLTRVDSDDGCDSIANSPDAAMLMNINDEIHMSDNQRERELSEIFARHGIDVEFVDGAP
jgi:hypothetical protein